MIIDLQRYRIWIILFLGIIAGCIITLFIYNKTDETEHPAPEMQIKPLQGEFIYWKEVDQLFPRWDKADVIDYETKLQFRVQRRGGTYHADVQPLTAEDTAIMKSAYQGSWSWHRRAVIVLLDNGKKIAASMNGMPHGNGNISGNNFNGHFCIHFRDSKTHCSHKVDFAHQLMTWKAAGIVKKQLASLTPMDTLYYFLAAIDEKEQKTAALMVKYPSSHFLLKLTCIDDIRICSIKETDNNLFNVEIFVKYTDDDSEYLKNFVLTMLPSNGRYLVDIDSLMPLFDRNAYTESYSQSNLVLEEEDFELEI